MPWFMPISTGLTLRVLLKSCTHFYHMEQRIASATNVLMTLPILCNLSIHSLDFVGVANLVLPVCSVVTNGLLGHLHWLLVILGL